MTIQFKGPPSGKIAGWMNPDLADDVGRPWYPVGAMRRKNVEVEVVLPHGEICGALVKHWPSIKSPLWWVRPDGKEIGRFMTVLALSAGRWPHWHPVAWRPLAGVAWPDALPEPLPAMRFKAPDDDEVSIPEAGEPVDGWPRPGVRLGRRVPPATIEECEARVLRGIRTMNSSAVADAERPSSGSSNAYIIMRNAVFDVEGSQTARRRSFEVDHHFDRGHIPSVRSAWSPDRRDKSDWDYALDWWLKLDERARGIVRMRAANPVHSWRSIGQRYGLKQSTARFKYAQALLRLFEIAKSTEPDKGA